MKMRVVIDTNIWIRILLRGKVTLPILEAFNESKFQLIISQPLFDEFQEVWHRPRLSKYISESQAIRLEKQIKSRATWVETKTIPPQCRDVKDLPILATAIDGKANIIVSGDDDLRGDETLRKAMKSYSIELLGVNSFLESLQQN